MSSPKSLSYISPLFRDGDIYVLDFGESFLKRYLMGKYEVGTLIEEKIITIRNSKTPISEFIKSIKSGLVNNDCKKYLEISFGEKRINQS